MFLAYLRLKGEGINGDTIDGDIRSSQYENSMLLTKNIATKRRLKERLPQSLDGMKMKLFTKYRLQFVYFH